MDENCVEASSDMLKRFFFFILYLYKNAQHSFSSDFPLFNLKSLSLVILLSAGTKSLLLLAFFSAQA